LDGFAGFNLYQTKLNTFLLQFGWSGKPGGFLVAATTPSPYTHAILHNANSPFFAHLHGGLFAAKSMHKAHSNHVPR
jgi:hypothetical protein